jgi:hypothetical protein
MIVDSLHPGIPPSSSLPNGYLADRAARHPLARQGVARREVFIAEHVVLAKRHLALQPTRYTRPTDPLLAYGWRRETRTPHGLEESLSSMILQSMGAAVEPYDHLRGCGLQLRI